MAATTLTARSLYDYALRTADDRVGDQADQEAEDAVNLALEMLAKVRRWPWYHDTALITYIAPENVEVTFTQGSDAITTTGTFPSWIASGSFYAYGQVIDVTTRTDDTNAVIEAVWPYPTETLTVTFFQDRYTLPSAALAIDELYPGQNWIWGGQPVSIESLWRYRNDVTTSQQQHPAAWAINKDDIVIWPKPTQAVFTRLAYYRMPTKPTSDTDEIDWDPNAMEPLLRAIEYQIAIRYFKEDEGHVAAAKSLFLDAVRTTAPFDKGNSDLISVGGAGQRVASAFQRPSWRTRST